MSEIYQVADAVAAAINAAPFASAGGVPLFVARRVYAVRLGLATVERPMVFVVPRADDVSAPDRDGLEEDLHLTVFVLQAVDADVDAAEPASNAGLDPLLQLCRRVALLFGPGDQAAGTWWSGSLYAPMFDVQRLENDRLFLGVIHLTFKQLPG